MLCRARHQLPSRRVDGCGLRSYHRCLFEHVCCAHLFPCVCCVSVWQYKSTVPQLSADAFSGFGHSQPDRKVIQSEQGDVIKASHRFRCDPLPSLRHLSSSELGGCRL